MHSEGYPFVTTLDHFTCTSCNTNTCKSLDEQLPGLCILCTIKEKNKDTEELKQIKEELVDLLKWVESKDYLHFGMHKNTLIEKLVKIYS